MRTDLFADRSRASRGSSRHARSRVQYQRRLRVEPLEDRRLLSVTLPSVAPISDAMTVTDGFDYPVGDRGYSGSNPVALLEFPDGSFPEINDLYPNSPSPNPVRWGSTGSGWHDYQDVGSYSDGTTTGGIHSGEDWNLGSGDADAGEPVYAVANGVVKWIVQLSSSPSALGWGVVVLHTLPSGQQYYSIYEHVTDVAHTDGTIAGLKTAFSIQEEQTVVRGQMIARIGRPTATDCSPHLHFEIRNYVGVLAPGSDLYPNDNGNGYYSDARGLVRPSDMTEAQVSLAYALMQTDGILDPSDFIDVHRPNTAVDPTPPTVSAYAASAVTTGGGTGSTFTVIYTDNVAVDVTTLDGSDVRVTGPNGYNQLAMFLDVDNETNGTPRTATYEIAAPGGTWDATDNGSYSLIVQSDEVGDINGNYVATTTFGSFNVSVPVVTTSPITLISPGGDENVEGGLRIVLDSYGAFGSSAWPADDAWFNPPGDRESSHTTFESAVFLWSADWNDFLAEGSIGGSGNLPSISFDSASASSAVSSFACGNLFIVLTQSIQDRFDSLGAKTGSVLVQTYRITNTSTSSVDFSMVRYLDGDLFYSGNHSNDWGGASTTDRSMNQQLFEFDTGDDPNNPTTLIGIRAIGGVVPENYFEIDRYPGLLYRIIDGIPLDNMIEGDDDGDLVTDDSYDVTLALQRDFHLSPSKSAQYVTVTEFGLGTTGESPIDPIEEQQESGQLDHCDWHYQYAIGFRSSQELVAHIRVDLVGDAPVGPNGEDLTAIWEAGIESAWNGQFEIVDGINRYPIVVDVEWVDTDADYTVVVHSGSGGVNTNNFYTDNPSGHGFDCQGIIAAHEAGHWLGLYDEYNPKNPNPWYRLPRPFVRDPAWWPLYDERGNRITDFWELYDGVWNLFDGVHGAPRENWRDLSANADMNALMAQCGEMEPRYYQALVDWLAGKTGRDLVLAEAPTFTHRESMDEFFDAPPGLSETAVDLTLVRSPSSFDDSDLGERATLPESIDWIDEWDTYWVEVWVSTPNGDSVGVAGAQLDLTYDTNCFSPTQIEYGPAFAQNQTGAIDDSTGVIDDLGAATLSSDIGDNHYALLARVKFESTNDDSGTPLNANGHYVTPVANGLGLSNVEAALVGLGMVPLAVADLPNTELWPVMYDLDDDGQVGLGDLSYFAAAYHHNVGDAGVNFTWASDFDRDGEIGLGDLSYFAAAYRHEHTEPVPMPYPFDFPAEWHQVAEEAGIGAQLMPLADLAPAGPSAESSAPTARIVAYDEAICGLVGQEEKAASTLPEIEGSVFSSEETNVACDAVLTREYGPRQFEPSTLYRQHLAWSHTMARRNPHSRENDRLKAPALAADVLFAIDES